MKRLLVTREAERSAPLAAALAPHGIEVVSLPLTRIVPMETATPELDQVRWVVLTSVNGVRRFHESHQLWFEKLSTTVRLAALGQVTIEAARDLLPFELTVATGRTGAELAEALLETDPTPGTVLWPCAEKTIGDLATILGDAGATVIRWPLYRTEPLAADTIREQASGMPQWDAILFAAPSAVKTWVASIETPFDRPSIAIGTTTQKALLEAGASQVTTALTPDTTGMTDAVLTVLGSSLPVNEKVIHHG